MVIEMKEWMWKNKRKRLAKLVGTRDYDLMFDVVHEWLDLYNIKNITHEAAKNFYRDIEEMKDKYF